MLIKKAVAVRKHLSTNRKDKDGKLYVDTAHANQLNLD
jgi:ribosomal protein S15P/S13E